MEDVTKCRFRGTLTKIRGHYVNKARKEKIGKGDVTHFYNASYRDIHFPSNDSVSRETFINM